jgi:hypothetical protein
MSRSTSPHVAPEPRSERSWSARRDSFQRDFAVQKVVVRIKRELYGASAAVLVERRPAFRCGYMVI